MPRGYDGFQFQNREQAEEYAADFKVGVVETEPTLPEGLFSFQLVGRGRQKRLILVSGNDYSQKLLLMLTFALFDTCKLNRKMSKSTILHIKEELDFLVMGNIRGGVLSNLVVLLDPDEKDRLVITTSDDLMIFSWNGKVLIEQSFTHGEWKMREKARKYF